MAGGTQSGAPWPDPTHFYVQPIAFSTDGRLMAFGYSIGERRDDCPRPICFGRIDLWDLASGQRVLSTELEFSRVMSLAFSRDGRWLFSGHEDGALKVWSTTTRSLVKELSCCDGRWVRALAVAPGDRRLAIGAQDGSILVWDFAGDPSAGSVSGFRRVGAHVFGVSSLEFDASGDYLLSAADDQHVRRWSVATGASYEFSRAPGLGKAHRGMVKSVVSIRGGTQAVSGSYWEGGTYKDYKSVAPPDAILRLWDVNRAQLLRSYPFEFGIRCCIQVVEDRGLIAVMRALGWDERPIVELIDIETGAVTVAIKPELGERFEAFAMHPDHRHFVISIGDGQFWLWDRGSKKMVARLISVAGAWAVQAVDGRIDFSPSYRQWRCEHDLRLACSGGAAAQQTAGLLATLLR